MVIVGDLHCKKDEIRVKVITDFFLWLETIVEQDEDLVLLGDIFDVPLLDGWLIEFMMRVLKPFKKVYVLKGNDNHDGTLLKPLGKLKNIHIVDIPGVINLDGQRCLFLPNQSHEEMDKYKDLDLEADLVFGHFTMDDFFREKAVALPQYDESKIILGHIHIQDGKYLGVPYPTRYLEHEQEHRIASIRGGKLEYIKCPKLFTYHEVEYGDEVDCEYKHYQLIVNNAPTRRKANKMYKGHPIYKINVEVAEQAEISGSGAEIENEFSKKVPLEVHLESYGRDNVIPRPVYKVLAGLFKGV
jgi:hypothetical protein